MPPFEGTFTQEAIYQQTAHRIVESVLEGFNGTIFAYGQTGTGKTFTMEGKPTGADGELRGVVPRACEQVFAAAHELALLGWQFEYHASCLEIYNEELHDLLPDPNASASSPKSNSSGFSCGGGEPEGEVSLWRTDGAELH